MSLHSNMAKRVNLRSGDDLSRRMAAAMGTLKYEASKMSNMVGKQSLPDNGPDVMNWSVAPGDFCFFAEPHLAAGADPHLAAGAEPHLAAGAEPHLAAGAEPHLAAGADPHLAAGADPHLAAGAEPHLAAGAEPHLAAGADPHLAARAKELNKMQQSQAAVPLGSSSGGSHASRGGQGVIGGAGRLSHIVRGGGGRSRSSFKKNYDSSQFSTSKSQFGSTISSTVHISTTAGACSQGSSGDMIGLTFYVDVALHGPGRPS